MTQSAAYEERLRRFTIGYFTALGARMAEENGLLRVELEPDQMAELEGRTGPRMSFWGLQEEGTTVLYLAFNRTIAEAAPQAELIANGSHRLEQMCASARRQGRLGLFTVLPRGYTEPADDLHTPYLLLHFRIEFYGRQKFEELCTVCIDLTDGSLHPEVARRAESATLVEKTPRQAKERVLSFRDAWEIACDHVVKTLRVRDDGWAREALLALAQEKRFLEQFYAEQAADKSGFASEREERLAEADRRSRPKAIARIAYATVLLAP